MSSTQIIQIRPEAAAKPALGQACNGCGVCCLSEPCPLGVVLSGRRKGACEALRWQADSNVYRCGAITDPAAVFQQAMPGWLSALAVVLAPALRRLAGRWIASGTGCDCDLEVTKAPQSDRQSTP